MRYGTIPRWTYVMLIVMGLGFMVGADAFFTFVPKPTGSIVGAIWLVMGACFVAFSVRALQRRKDEERVAREGTRATATLLAARTTGLTINNMPQWALRLRIDGAGASYETTLKLLTFSPPGNGATFPVRVDPLKREHVVLADDDDDAGGSAPVSGASAAAVPQTNAALLDALRQAGLAAGETAVVNADGSRTITTSSVSVGGDAAGASAADTVRLLADLDRMRGDGSLSEAEFAAVKAKLLGGT